MKNKTQIIFFGATSVFFFLFSILPVHAGDPSPTNTPAEDSTSKAPPLIIGNAVDQRCWEKKICESKGTFYDGTDAKTTCGNQNAVGEPLGFCAAGGTATTSITFAGKRKFSNIGEFIETMYKYGIMLAGVLAVIMIVIAGAQWTVSGGNTQMIGSAKKRIVGAIVGLLLAVLSYTILNTINPYLTNLRLPQTWMINSQGLAPPSCIMSTHAIAPLGKRSDKITAKQTQEVYKKTNFRLAKDGGNGFIPTESYIAGQKNLNDYKTVPRCEYNYVVQGAPGQSCRGTICGKNEICIPYEHKTIDGKLRRIVPDKVCREGQVRIHLALTSLKEKLLLSQINIDGAGFVIERLKSPGWIEPDEPGDTKFTLYPVCKDFTLAIKPTQVGRLPAGSTKIKHLSWYFFKPEGPFYEYYIDLKKLDSLSGCPEGKPLGVILRIKLEEEKGTNWNLYIGSRGDSNIGVAGSWENIDIKKDYIPIDFTTLHGGRFIELNIDDRIRDDVAQNQLTEPPDNSPRALLKCPPKGIPERYKKAYTNWRKCELLK